MDFRVRRQELRAHLNQRRLRNGDLQIAQQHRRNQLVYQDPRVLRIVAKLHHVPAAIIRFEQMGLRSAAHFPHMPDSL